MLVSPGWCNLPSSDITSDILRAAWMLLLLGFLLLLGVFFVIGWFFLLLVFLFCFGFLVFFMS